MEGWGRVRQGTVRRRRNRPVEARSSDQSGRGRSAPDAPYLFMPYLGVEAQFVELHGDAFRAVVELADHVLVLLRQGVADGPVREGLPAVAPIHLVVEGGGGVRGREKEVR